MAGNNKRAEGMLGDPLAVSVMYATDVWLDVKMMTCMFPGLGDQSRHRRCKSRLAGRGRGCCVQGFVFFSLSLCRVRRQTQDQRWDGILGSM